jgi:hypothetical protein
MNDTRSSDSASTSFCRPRASRRSADAGGHNGAGVGKPTVAAELVARLRWTSEDGKALHPEVNIAKMHARIPLIRLLTASAKIDKSATPA